MTRPRVLMNMATSIDGKIALAPSHRPAQFRMSRGEEDHRRMRALRARCDAIIIGSGNLRADDPELGLLDADRAKRASAGLPDPMRVVVTRSGKGFSAKQRVFDPSLGGRTVIAHPRTLPASTRSTLDFAELVEMGDQEVDVAAMLGWLYDEGARVVLCEGGGELNAQMFRAGVIDEMYVTLVPRVIGGREAPTIADGAPLGLDAVPDARLASCEQVGDELYLRYVVNQ